MNKQETKQDTEVILVVKGAGVQQADETLNLFLKGFWPAINAIANKATIRQRNDVFPGSYRSSPHADAAHNNVTEINANYTNEANQTVKRRIWVKEAYWETEVKPGSPVAALFKEWHMASYAFGVVLYEFLTGNDSSQRRKLYKNPFSHFMLYFMMYLGVVFPGLLLAMMAGAVNYNLLTLIWQSGAVAVVISLLAALPPAKARLKFYTTTKRAEKKQLPGMGSWVFLLLVITITFSPAKYLGSLLVLLVLEFAILWSRHLAWPYREIGTSDTDTHYYYRYTHPDGGLRIGRTDRPLVKISQLLYRYLVVGALPIIFPFVMLAKLLSIIPFASKLGAGIDKILSATLSSVLGDVVVYAMDPTHAHRVRSVIINDINFFSQHEDVSTIHVFAHSQGTPITFETLYNHIPPAFRAKIKTYVTIGSVLSLYQQADPVLDEINQNRFPGFPYPDSTEKGYFHEDFQWFNVWNMYDAITEFYALDEYNLLTDAPYGKLAARRLYDLLLKGPNSITMARILSQEWASLVQPPGQAAEKIRARLDEMYYGKAMLDKLLAEAEKEEHNEKIISRIRGLTNLLDLAEKGQHQKGIISNLEALLETTDPAKLDERLLESLHTLLNTGKRIPFTDAHIEYLGNLLQQLNQSQLDAKGKRHLEVLLDEELVKAPIIGAIIRRRRIVFGEGNTTDNAELAQRIAALGPDGGKPDQIRKLLEDRHGNDIAESIYEALRDSLSPRHPASPVNLRSQGTVSPLQSHFEYWDNLDDVQIPFAQRVLKGNLHPQNWSPNRNRERNPYQGKKRNWNSHSFRLVLNFALILLVVVAATYGLLLAWNSFLGPWALHDLPAIGRPALDKWDTLGGIPPTTGTSWITTLMELFRRVIQWLLSEELYDLRAKILWLYTAIVALIVGPSGIGALFNRKSTS